MSWVIRGLIFLCLVLSSVTRSVADNGWEGEIVSIRCDNDSLNGTDRHYTQGAWISYWSRDEALPGCLKRFSAALPSLGMDVKARKVAFGIGQEIYTPANLQTATVIPDDRPYAGWLFASSVLERRGEILPTWPSCDIMRLDLGVIGPESQAELAQDLTHSEKPKGWGHQLQTEPAFELHLERRFLHRLTPAEGKWNIDWRPGVEASAGTVATYLGLGTEMRFGYQIPNEFEVPAAITPLHYGAYFSVGAEGRYVIRNIFLDGNTFRASEHIDKQPFVAELRVGFTLVLKSLELTAAQTLRTREFKGQPSNDVYGTATVSLKF